jgi:hypothetical protein
MNMSSTDGKSAGKRKKPWWKIQEEVSFLFETLFRPLEKEILHDTRQRDVVGVLRQLDVGVIDSNAAQNRVKALVEVQKRKCKVGIDDFGSWIYKRNTLQAEELVIVSPEGFTSSVLTHAKKEGVRLGMLREVETAFIAQINSTFLGPTRVWDKWWFASVFVQYADVDEIRAINLQQILNYEDRVFGSASLLDLIQVVEKERGDLPSGQLNTFTITSDGGLSYCQRPIKCVMITAEKQRRIWNPKATFFAYEEVYPHRSERGIAVVSQFRLDDARLGRLVLVISPDATNESGRNVHLAGQFEFM